MKKNYLVQCIFLGALLSGLGEAVDAAGNPNPINAAYVQLSPSDWEAACSSGNTGAGCFGNVGSVAYAKLERLLGYPAAAISLSLQSIPASVYIKQYGPSYPPSQTGIAYISADNVVGVYTVCAAYTASGAPVGLDGILVPGSENPNDFQHQYSRNALGIKPLSHSTNLTLAQDSNNTLKNPITPEYVVCLGQSSVTATSTPQALTNLVLT